jgi:hypothetical protein
MARTRGILVYPLAPAAYDVPTADRYALGVNQFTGETFLIHSEGVTYRVTHEKPWRFNDYSVVSRWFSVKEVREFPVLHGVDLADWVRSFGQRLETNFGLAYGILTTQEATEEGYNHEVYSLLPAVPVKYAD